MNVPVLYIVVPCYNEEEILCSTIEKLQKLLACMIEEKKVADTSRLLFVNDGSSDSTWSIISKKHTESNSFVCGINLSGNVGHQNALFAGVMCAKENADMSISIDADLQDDINVIPEMVSRYMNGDDIVYGVRRQRDTDTWFKRNTALMFYKLMKALGVKSVYNHADYRLMSKRAMCQLEKYSECNLFLRGIVPLLGYKSSSVYYDRSARLAGESKYPLRKMLNFAIDGITSFSVKPLRLLTLAGFIFVLVSISVSIWALVVLLRHETVQGWTSLIISMWFIGGVLLMGMGIVGEYIGKMYMEVKGRPRYNIDIVLIK